MTTAKYKRIIDPNEIFPIGNNKTCMQSNLDYSRVEIMVAIRKRPGKT